ncbi:MAG TPA: glycosyltransferase family 4 protein [Acidimicrobiales bacterium]|nr:glycosyltransferase family 4 protein [Acidimicrobiales bacterium]
MTELAPFAADTPLFTDKIGDLAAAAGIRHIDMFGWRDLEHPEAGGSEVHAARIAERWAAAGIDVRLTVSRGDGAARRSWTDGYQIDRPAGRYGIFPRTAVDQLRRRRAHRPTVDLRDQPGTGRATVEIWNGMPFLSPIWAPGPRLVFLHHVHDRMWDLVLPPSLAAAGRFLEKRIAPPVYRSTPVVTLSESSRQDIIRLLGFPADRVHVVRPGVEESFHPALPHRSPVPLVVAVGRLVTYKRFDSLVDTLARLHRRHPELRAVIAGEGAERPHLEQLIRDHGAEEWLTLPGRVDDDELLALYQQAWVLAAPSAFEGWGLTISEAAACATPSVASPIAGHADAVEHGITGFLAEPGDDMESRIDQLIGDDRLRRRMQRAARLKAESLTWDRTSLEAMRILAAQA